MKKSTYEERGAKFAEVLAKRFEGCVTFDDFRREIQRYNMTHIRKLDWDHGVSRIAIIRADYVIKFDFNPTGLFSDGRAGNCSSEEAIYARAVADGMEHLLAKTTVLTLHGLTCSIMPRIKGIGTRICWEDTVTPEEESWLYDNLNDLHMNNYGFRKGKICVIDYAWDAVQPTSWLSSWETSSSYESMTCETSTTWDSFSPVTDSVIFSFA